MNERLIFSTALSMAQGPERAKFLDEACGGDAPLRARIESLLATQELMGNFLESPAWIGTSADPSEKCLSPTAEGPGTMLGPFRLLNQIGEGGFGVVFLAEQEQPIRRRLAVKILKPGMDSRQVVARFEAERQALALMDHPHIARVIDGGQTPAGRPYFVMDLVHGAAITDYCDEQKLTIPERLRLFITVCQAVQHAHQKGIIHRDLKPSNILVTQQDGVPLVKVIDFGVAKAIGPAMSQDAELTGVAQLIGTPLYMSPEQAALGGVDVDTRSDIYSLGVLLYELLTGTTPIDKSRVHRVSYDELRRLLREEDPPSPSTRLRAAWRAEPRKRPGDSPLDSPRLHRHLAVELDWIVMKCLEKDRDRRYESASALGADIGHYLGNEPVLAGPPTAWYRFRKFARRRRQLLALSAVILLLLLTLAGGALLRSADLAQSLRTEKEKRWESLHSSARALRMSRQPGQRLESLRLIGEAMQLPLPPDHSLAELRTEAIAALALPDIAVEREWPGLATPGIVNVAVDGNLRFYACLMGDGMVTVRQVDDDRLVAEWKEKTDRTWPMNDYNLRFSPDGRYLTTWHVSLRRLAVRRIDDPRPIVCEKAADGDGVDFLPDSSKIAYLTEERRLAILDLATGQKRVCPPVLRVLKGAKIAISPDGARFAVGVERAGKYAIEVRDLATGQLEKTLPHSDPVSPAAWSSDGVTLVTTCRDRVIRVWEVSSEQLIRSLTGHMRGGVFCSLDHSSKMLVSNDWGNVLRLWEISSGRQQLAITAGGYNFVRVGRDDRLVVAKFAGNLNLQLLSLHTSRVYRTIGLEGLPATEMKVHPDGRLLAVNIDEALALVDLATGRELTTRPTLRVARPLRWGGAESLVTYGVVGMLRWPLQLGAGGPEDGRLGPPERTPITGPGETWGASADGQTIAVPNPFGKNAFLWHLLPARNVKTLGHYDVRSCAVSPDGRWVATGGHGSTDESGAKVWHGSTGVLAKELPLSSFCSVAFSPNGRWLLTTAGGCRLWEVGTWNAGPIIGGETACFSPDSQLMAVQDTLGAVRLVETDTGKEVARLESPEQSRLNPGCFTPDGTQLILAGSDSKAIHIWDLRALRQELIPLGLDWGAPPYPPAATSEPTTTPTPLRLILDLGDLKLPIAPDADPGAIPNDKAWSMVAHDADAAIELAQDAVRLAPKVGTYWNTLGVAHYRAGHWKLALDALNKSRELMKGELESFNTFFLAMTYWRLGEKENARKCFDQAVAWMEKNKPLLVQYPSYAVELGRFRAEAEALLGVR